MTARSKLVRLWRDGLRRPVPHGRLSISALFPRGADARRHVQYWRYSRPTWPVSVLWGVSVCLWLKWIFWSGWRAIFQSLGQWENEASPSKTIQFIRLIRISLWAGLPPRDAYRFELIDHPVNHWRYISDVHVHGFHNYRNKDFIGTADAIALLNDKVAAAEFALSCEVKTPDIIAIIPQGSDGSALSSHLQTHGALFCKSQNGSRGDGALYAQYIDGEYSGQTFDGQTVSGPDALIAALCCLCETGPVLMQPLLRNHCQIHPFVQDGSAVTLRIITTLQNDMAAPLCAYLEVPIKTDSKSGQSHLMVAVNIDDGTVHAGNQTWLDYSFHAKHRNQFFAHYNSGAKLPYWKTLQRQSVDIHTQIGTLWGIAWDWIITDDGAVLLEGNSAFSLTVPQLVLGGLADV